MSDSDDDFSDDIVLDDQTLAILDEEESRFKRAAHPDAEDLIPPAKRRKLEPGRPLNFGTFSHSTPDDAEYLPDITVRSDGTYGVELQGPIALAPKVALDGNVRPPGTNVAKAGTITSSNPFLVGDASLHHPSQSRRPAHTRPAPVPSERVASQPIPRSQSVSRPHAADPSSAALFDAQLADMRTRMIEV